MSTPALDELIGQLNARGIRVAWVDSMRRSGVLVKDHQFVVLAADRDSAQLVRALQRALEWLDYPDDDAVHPQPPDPPGPVSQSQPPR